MMQEYVLGFAFDEQNSRVLLVEKRRGPGINLDKWNGIGGKIESSESAKDAMQREWIEETNLPPQDWTEFGELRGEGFYVSLFSTKFLGNPRTSRANDVGEILAWVSTRTRMPSLAQNVPTMVSHALYGTGTLFLRV